MSSVPARTHQSYRHEAFLWSRREDYLDGLVPFVSDGLAAGEAVMLALVPEHTSWMRRTLGAKASKVHFVDITELGGNPARIIPAWSQFVEDWSGAGRPARGVGEPIWPERHPAELLEAQLHEALLNLAVDPQIPFWLLCPYDEQQLNPEVLEEAHRSHPAVATRNCYQGSPSYGGHAHARTLFTETLPKIDGESARLVVNPKHSDDVFTFVTLQAAAADVPSNKIINLADAVRRLAASSVDRKADRILISVWDQADLLICEVSDSTGIDDYLIGRRLPRSAADECLWAVNRLCDLVQLRSSSAGTTIRLHVRK